MADDNCACLYDHESAMQRLINLLRSTQQYCTDTECLQDGPGGVGGNSMLLWTMMWGLLALALFFMRPKSMRSNPQSLDKPGPSNQDRDNQPPPPGIH